MSEEHKSRKIFDIIAIVFALLGIIATMTTTGLSVVNAEHSKYSLALALIFVGISRIFLLIYNRQKEFFIYHVIATASMFALSVLVALSAINIYFLTVSFFVFCIFICISRLLGLKKNHSVQQIIFTVLSILFVFIFSFIFLFPSIYEKHATSVSNWNFIVLSYSVVVFFVSIQNILTPLKKKLKLNTISNVLQRTMTLEILLGLLVLVLLFSIYFTLVEPNINSFADALWYSFSVITTIGFGDVTVTTTLGRILSVILGLYSIAVVGVITSIIVMFYNEAYKRRKEAMAEKLAEEENKKEESK